MSVIRQLEVEAIGKELAKVPRERQRFDGIGRVGAALDGRGEQADQRRPGQADELAAAQLRQVLEVDARTAKVRPEQMAAIVESNQGEPGLFVPANSSSSQGFSAQGCQEASGTTRSLKPQRCSTPAWAQATAILTADCNPYSASAIAAWVRRPACGR